MVGILSSCIPAVVPAPLHYGTLQRTSGISGRLQSTNDSFLSSQSRARMVVSLSGSEQWETNEDLPAGLSHLHRCITTRLGSNLPRCEDRWNLDIRGKEPAYQLSGTAGSMECCPGILPGKAELEACFEPLQVEEMVKAVYSCGVKKVDHAQSSLAGLALATSPGAPQFLM